MKIDLIMPMTILYPDELAKVPDYPAWVWGTMPNQDDDRYHLCWFEGQLIGLNTFPERIDRDAHLWGVVICYPDKGGFYYIGDNFITQRRGMKKWEMQEWVGWVKENLTSVLMIGALT